MKADRRGALRQVAVGALAVALVCGCASLPGLRRGQAPRYRFFEQPDLRDPWSAKIRGWQQRETLDAADAEASPAVSGAASRGPHPALRPASRPLSDLGAQYRDFRAERRREVARQAAAWIQRQARTHYLDDGPVDHWATLEETLRRGGEDCDGLELLVYHLLRDLGFGADEVYRAVVYRPSDGQHHMVTLWFEERDDPWVLDPTGAMTTGMPHLSEVPDWVPLKVFSENEEYTVRRTLPTLYPTQHAGR